MPQSSSYTKITVFRSETADATPALEDLAVGELAVNIADAVIYTKNTAGQLVVIGAGTGVVTEGDTTIGNGVTLEEYITNLVNTTVANYFRPSVVEDAGTSRTIAASDETNLIYFTSDSAITVTIPTDDTIIPVGFICHLHQGGSGQITVAGATGAVTIESSRSLVTAAEGSAFSLFKTGVNRWTVLGDQA